MACYSRMVLDMSFSHLNSTGGFEIDFQAALLFSFSGLLHSIEGISQKMLLEQLKELKQFGLVGKKSYAGYPLKVEYFLTDMGLKMLSAIEIMQGIGIEYMVKHGMSEILDEKGICY